MTGDLLKEVWFTWNFLWQDKKMWPLITSDCLNRGDCMSRFDCIDLYYNTSDCLCCVILTSIIILQIASCVIAVISTCLECSRSWFEHHNHTPKLFNQNKVLIGCNFMIGHFSSLSTNLELERKIYDLPWP